MALPKSINNLPTTLTIRTSSPTNLPSSPSIKQITTSSTTCSSLLSLPTDILHLFLLPLPSFGTLHSLFLTHPIFHQLFSLHPTSITTTLAHRSYPLHALRLLHFSHPTSLDPHVRRFIIEKTDGLWGQADPSLTLSTSTQIGIAGATRLKADSRVVDRLVRWAEGIMGGRSIIGYSEARSGTSGGDGRVVYPLFDGQCQGSDVSESEQERVRKGVYSILNLAGSFFYSEETDEMLFDCSEVLSMPLEELFYILCLLTYFSTWSLSKELLKERKLVKVLEYRVYDDRKVRDVDESWDLRYSVEYLRRVGLRDRWQGDVLEMVAVSEGEKGFDGGYRREGFEERVVKLDGEERSILVLKVVQ